MINRLRAIVTVWIYTAILIVLLSLATVVSWLLGEADRELTRVFCVEHADLAAFEPAMIYLNAKGMSDVALVLDEAEGCQHAAVALSYIERVRFLKFWYYDSSLEELLDESGGVVQSFNFKVVSMPPLSAPPLMGAVLLVSAGAAFLHMQRRRGKYVQAPLVRQARSRLVTMGVLAAIAMYGLLSVAFGLAGQHLELNLPARMEPGVLSPLMVLTIVLFVPVFEEIVFRAWLLEAWSRLMRPGAALLLSSIAFSAIHPMGLVENLIFLLPGIILGALWLRYRSLLACCVAHSSYNAAVIATHVWSV